MADNNDDNNNNNNNNDTKKKVIISLDIGSSSIRCSAYQYKNDEGAGVEALTDCLGVRKIRSVEPNTGKIRLQTEQGPLLDEIDGAVDDTLEKLREILGQGSYRIVALGFSTFVMNMIAVDDQGEPIGPEATISYACNTPEVSKECGSIKSLLSSAKLDELYQRTGAPLHSAYALPQLRAFYADPKHRSLCEKIDKWTTLSSVCLKRWGGANPSISFSEASWTGMLDFRRCVWEPEILSLLPEVCQTSLPTLADYCCCDVFVEPRWPELRDGCRFFLGLGDGACANVGSKCTNTNRIAVTIGTSAATRVVIPLANDDNDSFRVPPGLFCYRINRSHVLLGGALTDGGSVVEWARQLLGLSSTESFLACLNEVERLVHREATTTTTTVVPFLSGERSTGFRAGATFCALGFTRETTPAHFLKACMEGVVLRLGAVIRLLLRGTPEILVSGGALEKNALWRQMIADATGLRVHLDTTIHEATSRGAALMMATALSRETLSEEALEASLVSFPETNQADYWSRALENQENLIQAVGPLWL